MRIRVTRITIPPMSTIGYGYGRNVDTGDMVTWVGDHRPMRNLGHELDQATCEDDLVIELDDDTIGLRVTGLKITEV